MRRVVVAAIALLTGIVVGASQRKTADCRPVPTSLQQEKAPWPQLSVIHELDGGHSVRVVTSGQVVGVFVWTCR